MNLGTGIWPPYLPRRGNHGLEAPDVRVLARAAVILCLTLLSSFFASMSPPRPSSQPLDCGFRNSQEKGSCKRKLQLHRAHGGGPEGLGSSGQASRILRMQDPENFSRTEETASSPPAFQAGMGFGWTPFALLCICPLSSLTRVVLSKASHP